MNNLWFLAEVSPNSPAAPGKIVSEPVSGQTANTAVTAAPNTPAAVRTARQPQGMGWETIMLFVAMFVLLYFMMFRGPRKKQQQQRKFI
jgi:hypothetical protein